MLLPALCCELKLRTDGSIALVNSRDVADIFEKEHRNVLRDIDDLKGVLKSEQTSWFRQTDFLDVQGKSHRSFDLTRDGFTLLVMGWTGERAMAFKVKYIEAFNAMEVELQDRSPVTTDQLLSSIRELVAPLAIRFDSQDHAIKRVESRVDGLAQDVASIKARVCNGRRNLTIATKRVHVDALTYMGGRCPNCSHHDVVEKSQRLPFAEFDHFYQNSLPDADHTWLICKPCHSDLTRGQQQRDQAEAMFRAYQTKRRRIPGGQATLFG